VGCVVIKIISIEGFVFLISLKTVIPFISGSFVFKTTKSKSSFFIFYIPTLPLSVD